MAARLLSEILDPNQLIRLAYALLAIQIIFVTRQGVIFSSGRIRSIQLISPLFPNL